MDLDTDVQSLKRACAACGQPNPPGRLFCRRCTAPLEVVPLQELNAADMAECGGALIAVLAKLASPAGSPTSADLPPATGRSHIVQDLWRAYLSAFWLRPETALVLLGEALAVHSVANLPPGSWV